MQYVESSAESRKITNLFHPPQNELSGLIIGYDKNK